MGLLRREDDLFHAGFDGCDDPYWNESAWFAFMVPERNMQGAVYFHHRPNMNFSIGGVIVWDPSGREIHNCLFHDWGIPHATPDGAEMFDFELPNGLAVQCLEPLQAYRLRYGTDDASWYMSRGCRLDLEYCGLAEAHLSMMPKGQEEWGGDPTLHPVGGALVNGHYRQVGRIRGTLELWGEPIEINSYSLRDHSWGPRKLRDNPRGTLCWAIASEQSAFQVMSTSAFDPLTDPVAGAVDPVLCGSYLKDGEVGDVAGGKVMIDDRAPDGSPRSFVVECTDSLGRELRATGVSKNMLNWSAYQFMLMWWPQVEWTFDGQTAYGEGQDFWPTQHARSYVRSLYRH